MRIVAYPAVTDLFFTDRKGICRALALVPLCCPFSCSQGGPGRSGSAVIHPHASTDLLVHTRTRTVGIWDLFLNALMMLPGPETIGPTWGIAVDTTSDQWPVMRVSAVAIRDPWWPYPCHPGLP